MRAGDVESFDLSAPLVCRKDLTDRGRGVLGPGVTPNGNYGKTARDSVGRQSIEPCNPQNRPLPPLRRSGSANTLNPAKKGSKRPTARR